MVKTVSLRGAGSFLTISEDIDEQAAGAHGGVLSVLSSSNSMKIHEYSPNSIKSSTVGHGHADKISVQKQLKMIFGIDSFNTDDESDALAVAVCHALNRGTGQAVAKVSKSRAKGLAASVSHRIK